MTIRRALALAIFLWVAIARPSIGQEIRGTVRDTASRQPIPGAVLLLLDSTGATLGRNITNERGAYRIAAIPAMRRMRVVRIGFRPAEVALLRIDGSTPGVYQVDVAMTPLPTLLEPVRVTSGAKCPKRDDRLIALSLLEQARAGLLATIVAREANPANMIRLRFTQLMDGNSDRITHQEVLVDSSPDVKASFQAVRSAGDFVKLGFVIRSGSDNMNYLGPDAETLLDDGFRDGYCFELRDRDRSRPNQVGLRFVAADSKAGRTDIDGTLWIDTVARALRDIRFEFVGLDRSLMGIRPGGTIKFREMPNDMIIIDRWSFRIPSVRYDTTWYQQRPELRARIGAEESGGEVATARWNDSTTWHASLGTIRLHMVGADDKPAARREVRLEDTNYGGISDSAGNVSITRLLPGPYSAVVIDSTLALVGVPIKTAVKFTAARDEVIETTMKVNSAAAQVGSLCTAATRNATPDERGAWFIAKLFRGDGQPFAGDEWRAYRWEEFDWRPIAGAGGVTSSSGILQYCGGGLSDHENVKLEFRAPKSEVWISTTFTTKGHITPLRLQIQDRPQ